MSKLTKKIAIPIILAGLFAIIVFVSIGYDKLDPSFYIIVLFLVVYVFFFGLATGQNLSSPVKKLLERAKELSKGNLSSRVYLESKDEFSELAKAFNEIADELETSHAQEANTEKSVDIKVRARTQALEETINALEQKVRNRTIELQNMIKSLEKFQGDSTIKELELLKLRSQIKSLETDVDKKVKKQKVDKIESGNIEET